MKTFFTIVMLLIASVSFAKPKPRNDFKILSVKKNVLYFKVDRAFVGGVVEIYDANKKFMEADSLPHTHTMIYFDEMPSGHYVVTVKKGRKHTEFKYDSDSDYSGGAAGSPL